MKPGAEAWIPPVRSHLPIIVADPGGGGVPWNPPFLAILYTVYVTKFVQCFYFRVILRVALNSRKKRENVRVYKYSYYGNYVYTCADVLVEPPIQNPGSATVITLPVLHQLHQIWARTPESNDGVVLWAATALYFPDLLVLGRSQSPALLHLTIGGIWHGEMSV